MKISNWTIVVFKIIDPLSATPIFFRAPQITNLGTLRVIAPQPALYIRICCPFTLLCYCADTLVR